MSHALRHVAAGAWVALTLMACGQVRQCGSPERPDPLGGDGSGSGAAAAPIAPADTPESEPTNDRAESPEALVLDRSWVGALAAGDVDRLQVPAGLGAWTLEVETRQAMVTLEDRASGASTTLRLDGPATLGPFRRDGIWNVTLAEGSGPWRVTARASGDAPTGVLGRAGQRGSVLVTTVPSTGFGMADDPGPWTVRIPLALLADASSFGVAVTAPAMVPVRLEVMGGEERLLDALVPGGTQVRVPSIRLPSVAGPVDIVLKPAGPPLSGSVVSFEVFRMPPTTATVELEPNDERQQATLLQADAAVGFAHATGDVDWWRPVVEGVVAARVTVVPEPGMDVRVSWVSDSDSPDLPVADADREGSGGEEVLCAVRQGPDAPGTLRVITRSSPSSGSSYRLLWSPWRVETWEREPNDNAAAADRIAASPELAAATNDGAGGTAGAPGAVPSSAPEASPSAGTPKPRPLAGLRIDAGALRTTIHGELSGDDRQDVFVLEVPDEPGVSERAVSLRVDPEAPADYTLEIVDDEGGAVARSDRGGIGESEVLSVDLPAGRYHARLSRKDVGRCVPPYRLVVSDVTPEPSPEAEPEGSGASADAPVPTSLPPAPVVSPDDRQDDLTRPGGRPLPSTGIRGRAPEHSLPTATPREEIPGPGRTLPRRVVEPGR